MEQRRHEAVEYWVDGRLECRRCGVRAVRVHNSDGTVGPLRHVDEAVDVVHPAPAYTRTFTAAEQAAASAIALLPEDARAEDVVRAAVQAIYRRGLLRQSPAAVPPAVRKARQVEAQQYPPWVRGPAGAASR